MAKIISALALLAVLAAASSSCSSQKTSDKVSEDTNIEIKTDTTAHNDSISLADTASLSM